MASQIKQRVDHRGFVARIINFVSGLLAEGKVQRLESVKRTLEEKMSLLQRIDDEILEGLKEEQEVCNEIDIRSSDIRLNIQETIFQIDSKLKEISISEERSSINSVNGFLDNSFEGRNNANGKLPNLSMKCFNGNSMEFQSFFDSFRAAIHENESLKNITKFNYLRTFLSGKALVSISSLSLTSENYNQAIEILEGRCGKKQLLITSHTDQLLSISPITSTNDIKKIRETCDKIGKNVQNLRSLDIGTSQYGPVLISIVMSKLPEDIKLQFSRSMPISCEWDFDELLAALLKEIESREMRSFINYSRKDNKYRVSRQPDNFTGAALFSGSNQSRQDSRLQLHVPTVEKITKVTNVI